MGYPIAIFGLPEQGFVEKVFSLRQKLLLEGNLLKEESLTVPHLTMLVNKNFPEPQKLDDFLAQVQAELENIQKFELEIKNFEISENSIIARFDNTYVQKLINNLAEKFPNFEPIFTDYMKIFRKVGSNALESALTVATKNFGSNISITAICVAGKELRKEDIIKTVKLI